MQTVAIDQNLFTATLDAVREAVLITDSNLAFPGPTIVYANAAFCHMTGYTLDEILGQTPRMFQGPETDRSVMRKLRLDLEAGRDFFGETINYRKDGSPFSLKWTIRPHPATGKPDYYIASLQDVTNLRNIEYQCQQLQTLANMQSRVGSAGLDLQTLRVQVTEVALAATGADGAAILEPINEDMVYTAVCGRAKDYLGLSVPISNSLSGHCYLSREPVHCQDSRVESMVDPTM